MELEEAIVEYARERGIAGDLRRRWQELPEADQSALLDLAVVLKLGRNHFRDVLDWCVEISLRDGVSVASIVGADGVRLVLRDARLGRNDKLKHVKESLRRLRFPRLARIEGEVQQRLRALRTDPRIALSVAPGLEGGVRVELVAHSADHLRRLALEVASLARAPDARRVFDLLAGNDASLSTS